MTTATAVEDYTYRVWVGCLACYNEGLLLGDWFDADGCPEDQESFNDLVKVPAAHVAEGHEEFWVMDHENSPVSGEYAPMDAQRYADWIKDLQPHEVQAFHAYINDADFDWDAVEKFREAYVGEFYSDIQFAQEQAADMGFFNTQLEWPASCIDWQQAARELMFDYFSENGFYFRSM